MKTKLTLNIDSAVIAKAKKNASNKKSSLSSIVEEYLKQFSNNAPLKKNGKTRKSIVQRIQELTKPVQISDSQVKATWHKHLEEKYGK